MPIIDVFVDGCQIDQRRLDESAFYILSDSLDPDNLTLQWTTDYYDPIAGGIVISLHHRKRGVWMRFLFPNWQLSIAGVDYPRALYTDFSLDAPFTLTYNTYHFVVTDPRGTQRPPESETYILSVATREGCSEPQYWDFTIQADHVGQALQQALHQTAQQMSRTQPIYEVIMVDPTGV